jgi:cysteine dioxygenase
MNFGEAIREILQEAAVSPERPTPGALAERVGRQAERYLDHVRYDPAQYVRHPILFWEDWEVMLISWQSGQITPIHDHRGVLGGMVILSGSIEEERFVTPRAVPELADKRMRPEGDLSETGPTVLHRLIPKSGKAVSLHIYRPPLRTMGIWDESGFQEIRPSQFELAPEVLALAAPRC